MKSIEFNEEDLNNIEAIGNRLFSDENDPTSLSYNRKIIRPKIQWFKILFYCVLSVCAYWALVKFFVQKELTLVAAICITGLLFVFFLFILLKKIIICLVRIYQRVAPESIRRKCRFEPSCSEYMILAIEKYGLWKGLSKGINRLKRCNIHNGGYDYP